MACVGGKNKLGGSPKLMKSTPFYSMMLTVPEAAWSLTNTSISFLTFSGLPSILQPGLKFNNPLEFIQKATIASFLNPLDRNLVTDVLPSFS